MTLDLPTLFRQDFSIPGLLLIYLFIFPFRREIDIVGDITRREAICRYRERWGSSVTGSWPKIAVSFQAKTYPSQQTVGYRDVSAERTENGKPKRRVCSGSSRLLFLGDRRCFCGLLYLSKHMRMSHIPADAKVIHAYVPCPGPLSPIMCGMSVLRSRSMPHPE